MKNPKQHLCFQTKHPIFLYSSITKQKGDTQSAEDTPSDGPNLSLIFHLTQTHSSTFTLVSRSRRLQVCELYYPGSSKF